MKSVIHSIKRANTSLRIRLAMIVTLAFLISLWTLTLTITQQLERGMGAILQEQQDAAVSYIASDIEAKLQQRIELLKLNARLVADLVNTPERAREFLKGRIGLHALYQEGILLIDRHGATVAGFPPGSDRNRIAHLNRDYYEAARSGREVAIGEARRSETSGRPMVAIAIPVRNAAGEIHGVLAGFALLADKNLFGQVERSSSEKTGAIRVIDPRNRRIVSSNAADEILQPVSAILRMETTADEALTEGSRIRAEADGSRFLSTAKAVPATGWLIQICLPTEEAFEPIYRMERFAYSTALILSLLSLTGVWFFVRQALRPLGDITGTIRQMAGNIESMHALPVSGDAEIADLAESFNTFLTQRLRADESQRLAATVFSHAREGIFITDPDGNILDANRTSCEITGYSREELLGKNPRLLNSGKHPKAFFRHLWKQLQKEGDWVGEIWNRRKNGEIYAELLSISAVRDSQGKVSHYVALFSDISPIKAHQHQLEALASHDTLTGLPNRALLADRLQQAMAQAGRRKQGLALCFIDLDGFKDVNDRHGHATGDHLLIALAGRMRQTLRESDTLARIGGDEFIALLPDTTDEESALSMASRLLRAANEPLTLDGFTLQVSASIGMTFYPQQTPVDAEQLIRQADRAMYQAKLAGKNCYCVFSKGTPPAEPA